MKTTQEINVFDLSGLDMEKATLYHHDKDNITYIYIGADKYNIPENSLAVMKEGGYAFAREDDWFFLSSRC